MTDGDSDQTSKPSAIPGLAIAGCFLTGVAGLAHAFKTGNPIGLLAAVGAFGFVVHTAFR